MALLNNVVPRYYGEFREQVLAGAIPVCREISLEMVRIDKLIADPDVYHDPQAIDGFVAFCEAEMTLTDGEDVHLLESFKLWAEALLSWYVYVDRVRWNEEEKRFKQTRIVKRLIDIQYLIVARGSAKSMYVAFLQAYFLTVDPSTTHQIAMAPTMKQADEVMSPIRTAIARARGPLFRFLTFGSQQNTTGARSGRPRLISSKRGIENLATNSHIEIRAMSIDKAQGLRSKYNSVDEWLSGDTRENVITALLQGARKFDDPVLVAISSEGTVRNGVGDDIKMELQAILKGDLDQKSTSIFYYKLDDISEVGNPAMWIKANPNMGLTVSYETVAKDIERAELFPSVRNEILAKRLGLPLEGYTFYFTYEETLPTDAFHSPTRYAGMPASLGIDLSRGDDFCAFNFLFPLSNGGFGVKARSYISRRTLDLLPGAKRTKYEEFMAEGSLIIMEGVTLDMLEVYDDVSEHWEMMEYDIRAVGFDPYNSESFMNRYRVDNGSFNVDKVIQGARTESVPLGELKKLARSRLLYHDQKIMTFGLGNAVAWEDTNGNRKLIKLRNDEKIDNVSATLDAFVAYSRDPDQFQ